MLVAPSWLALLLAALGLANGLQANQGQQQSNRGRSSSSQKPTANLTEPSSTTQSTLVAPTAATPSAEPPARAPAEAPRRQSGGAPLDDEYLVGVGIADITGPSADINLVSLLRSLLVAAPAGPVVSGVAGSSSGSNSGAATSSQNQAMLRLQYPSWRELRDIKLQLKINLNSLLSSPTMSLVRWAMPSQIKMQAEYTYANLVVQL